MRASLRSAASPLLKNALHAAIFFQDMSDARITKRLAKRQRHLEAIVSKEGIAAAALVCGAVVERAVARAAAVAASAADAADAARESLRRTSERFVRGGLLLSIA